MRPSSSHAALNTIYHGAALLGSCTISPQSPRQLILCCLGLLLIAAERCHGCQHGSHKRVLSASGSAAPEQPDWVYFNNYTIDRQDRLAVARQLRSTSRLSSQPATAPANQVLPASVNQAQRAAAVLQYNIGPTATAADSAATVVPQPQRKVLQVGSRQPDHVQPAATETPGPRCGVRAVNVEEHQQLQTVLHHAQKAAAAKAAAAEEEAALRVPAGMMAIASVAQQEPSTMSLLVNLYFHVITGTTPNSTVLASSDLLAQQLGVMNAAYGPYNIRFVLKGVTRVQTESWALTEINSPAETAMKSRLRKGGKQDLNIYLIRPASGTLGWSTFPWEMTKLGLPFDGVVAHIGTLPGGTMAPYNRGYTIVHEVGHWLGLLHVFENGCSEPGDSVSDTPPQASAAYGCPLDRDTCPGSGQDPVTNYMGYTDDACMTGFTAGQEKGILTLWDVYRGSSGNDSGEGDDNDIITEGGIPQSSSSSSGLSQQQQQQSGPVQASTAADNRPGSPAATGPVGMVLPILFRGFGVLAGNAPAPAATSGGPAAVASAPAAAPAEAPAAAQPASTDLYTEDPAAMFAQHQQQQQVAPTVSQLAANAGGLLSTVQPTQAASGMYKAITTAAAQTAIMPAGTTHTPPVTRPVQQQQMLQQQQQQQAQLGSQFQQWKPLPAVARGVMLGGWPLGGGTSGQSPSSSSVLKSAQSAGQGVPILSGTDNPTIVAAAAAAVAAAAPGAGPQQSGGTEQAAQPAVATGQYLQSRPATGNDAHDIQQALVAAMGSWLPNGKSRMGTIGSRMRMQQPNQQHRRLQP